MLEFYKVKQSNLANDENEGFHEPPLVQIIEDSDEDDFDKEYE